MSKDAREETPAEIAQRVIDTWGDGNPPVVTLARAYLSREAGEDVLTELWNATHEETSKGPQAYGWGWVDAMQTIRAQIEDYRARRGPGLVREVATAPEIDPAPPTVEEGKEP